MSKIRIRKGTVLAVMGTALPVAGHIVAKTCIDTMVHNGMISPMAGMLANTTSAIGALNMSVVCIKTGVEMNVMERQVEEDD